MSLIHWWPFVNDGKDYGLSSHNFSVTLENNGKLGKCVHFGNSSSSAISNANLNYANNSVSFSGWFKFNKEEIQNRLNTLTIDSTYTTPTGNLIGNNSYGGFGLIWQTNNIYRSGSFTDFEVFPYLRKSSQNIYVTTSSFTVSFDTWYHFATVLDIDNKNVLFYVNGSLLGYNTYSTAVEFQDYDYYINRAWVYGGNGPTTSIPFYCNDIRMYNHALSAKEVKEISKGLVLHYDFNDPYVEATTNRYAYSGTNPYWSATFYDSATGKYGYNSESNGQYEYVTATDKYGNQKKMVKVSLRTARSTNPYVHIDYLSGYIANNTYATVSLDMYSTCATYVSPYSYYSGYYFSYWNESTKQWVGGTSTSVTIPNLKKNAWNHIVYRVYRDTSEYNSGPGYLPVGSSSSTSDYWLFDNIQVEAKDHATPYVNGTRSAGTVFDCSGYNNNGTVSGSLQILKDSASGNYCADIINSYVRMPTPNYPECTILFWIKRNSLTNTRQFIYTGWPGISIELQTDNFWLVYYTYNSSYNTVNIPVNLGLTDNIWYHCAFVIGKNGNYSYINGVQRGSVAYKAPYYSSSDFRLGSYDSYVNFNAKIADFKIYSTALSASDILAEYNRKASIDKSGILFTGEFVEGNNTNIDITKTAMVKCNNIVEGTDNVKLVGGYTQLEYIDQVNPIAQGTSQHNRCVIDNVQYNYIEARLNVNGSGSSGGIMLAGKDGTWWRSWQGDGSSSVVMNPSSLSQNTWYDVKYTCNSVFTGLWTSGWSDATNYWTPQNLKINYIRTYNNSNLTGYFIPVKRNKDNALGLYDLINKKFYTNVGSGTFTAGPEIGNINAIYAKEIKEI